MLRKLYDHTIQWAASRHAGWVLAAVSFSESSFFPVPPDVLLIPMVLARRARAWVYAALCTATSVLGGLAGYAIGFFLLDTFALPVLDFYGYGEDFGHFATRYNTHGPWVVFIAGVTPLPYKVITIASGATGLDIVVFMTASLLARALRFFLIAGLLWQFGPPIRHFIEKYFGILSIVLVLMLAGGFIMAGLLV